MVAPKKSDPQSIQECISPGWIAPTPAGPSGSGVKVSPSKDPTKYCTPDPPAAEPELVLIATSTSGSDGDRDPVGVVLCLVSAAAYAVSLILQKPLVARLPAIEVTWIACTVGAVACLPFAGDLVRDAGDASPADLGWVLFLGVFPTAIAFSTYAFALSHMSAGNLSVTTYLVPPITVLLSWAILSEAPPAMAYVGGVLALVGVALARRRPRVPA